MNYKLLLGMPNIDALQGVDFESLGLISTLVPRSLSFIDDEKYIEELLKNKNVVAVLTNKLISRKLNAVRSSLIIVEVDKPRSVFFQCLNSYNLAIAKKKLSLPNSIDSSATVLTNIPVDSSIEIGKNTIVHPNVTIYPGVSIGENCEIHSHVSLGGQGFEYKVDDKEVVKVFHAGKLVIGNNVDIKEFCSVHKALFAYDSTVISDWTKVDAHSHIGHGNKIGRYCLICSHANVSGNSNLEDYVYVGPGADIPNRISVGAHAQIKIGSTVTKDVISGQVVSGNFAIPHQVHLKNVKSSLG